MANLIPTNRPTIHLITAGGTIAATPSEILTTIPDGDRLAAVTVESLLNIGSSSITPAHWVQLAICKPTGW